MAFIHVGTSGWNYPSFLGTLYPAEIRKRRFLEVYSTRLHTVELNASFYRSFPASTWRGWYDRTPPDFLWAVKANRFITHIRRLNVPQESVARLWQDLSPLGEKLAVVLFQLPPSLVCDPTLLEAFLELQPRRNRMALEARHPSWHCPEIWRMLEERGVAWVVSDTAGRYPMTKMVTADFAYVRLHGPEGLYHGLYGKERLAKWLKIFSDWEVETFVYFDNTDDGSAAVDALWFTKEVGSSQQ